MKAIQLAQQSVFIGFILGYCGDIHETSETGGFCNRGRTVLTTLCPVSRPSLWGVNLQIVTSFATTNSSVKTYGNVYQFKKRIVS